VMIVITSTIITSVNEIMFLLLFVCLLACVSPALCKQNYLVEFTGIFWNG